MPKHLAHRSYRLAIGVALALSCAQAHAQLAILKQRAYATAQQMELKPLPAEPNWAKISAPPLFTFAWASDFHLNSGNRELIRQAMHYIDVELKPAFLMITGDNNAIAAPTTPGGPPAPRSERRQRYFRRFLEENLKTPYVVIPGDNWPEHFEKVFGAFQFSFDYGGLHFLFTSLDRDIRVGEGLGVFEESTWQWMREDLKKNRHRPTLMMLHETIAPPTFLEAEKLERLLEGNPNVIASFCGHLHVDLDVTHGGVRYLICPGLGVNPRHGLKHVKVYPHALILRTIEHNAKEGRFEPVRKWQYVAIPQPLRAALHRPAARFAKDNYAEIPPHPRRYDPSLEGKTMQLFSAAVRYMGRRFSGNNARRPTTAASGR